MKFDHKVCVQTSLPVFFFFLGYKTMGKVGSARVQNEKKTYVHDGKGEHIKYYEQVCGLVVPK